MEKKWWHNKIAYQIYPKSFMDTNGDGIGDLKGITSKLDYLQNLGIDILWISPCYCSPLADQGYDISDYYNIDPLFGTMDDMDELLAEAKKRNIHILMDLVVNHCSDEHEWFKKACEDPDGKYGKYFYIRDWKEGEPLPCNWRSYFGGSVWEKLPGHDDKIYFHAFHKKQPDLNWENPELRAEVYKMMNWWLDKGISGFRLDAIINIKKTLPFKNYPADREDGMCDMDYQLKEAVGLFDFLQEMANETFRKHDAFSVGEVFNEKPEDLPLWIGNNGVFSTIYDFAETVINKSIKGWYDCKPVEPEQYKNAVFTSQKKANGVGFLSNIIENHDEPRGVSHYIPAGELTLAGKKMLAGLYFNLQGLPWIYQGQEIGMENFSDYSMDDADDISAIDEYKVAIEAGLTPEAALKAVAHYSRDNARSPFQWDSTANAGFSSGKPWLTVNPNYKEINLENQINDEASVYNFYKKLIALRKSADFSDTLIYGETIPYMVDQKNIMAYFRNGEKKLLVIGNYQTAPQKILLPDGMKKIIINNMTDVDLQGNELTLAGYQFLIIE